jgi:imidazolonepropionase
MLSEAFDSLWINGHLVTMAGSDEYGIINDGAVAVKDGRILWVGPAQELPEVATSNAARIEDLAGAWMTPGLIDCHTHLVYAGNRSNEFEMRLKGATYQDIAKAGGGILSTVRAVRAASEDEIYRQSLPRLKAMMADGITTLEIKSGYGLDTRNELKLLEVIRRLKAETPLRILPTFLGAHAVPPEYKGRSDEYVELIVEEMLPRIARQGLAVAVDAFCENIGFSLSQTERIFEAASAHGLSIKLHSEQLSDSKGAVLAARFNALSVDHLEHLDIGDIPALAESRCVAVLLPGAFYYLNETRKPPIDALRKAGVPMAVSTDANPGTSPVLSIRSTMNMACVLFQLTPAEALAGATVHAARALGLQDEIGTLEKGKAADFAVWDIDAPVDLAYQLGGNLLHYTVKNGQKIVNAKKTV